LCALALVVATERRLAMDFHSPDPFYTTADRARQNFRLAVKLALGFVAFLWFVHVTNWVTDFDPGDFGVRPRTRSGLIGILLAPLLHADFAHLIANSVPLAVLGATLLYVYPASALRVLPAIYLGPGIVVWLLAPGGVHIGASGLVYGLIAYILIAGVLRRDRRAIGAALLVCFMYGALLWGVLPIRHGMSWETHLAAALIGAATAFALRRSDVPPRRRYSWEDEPDGTTSARDGDAPRELP
jgi:membrane associated rhomboid family serine protease